MKNTDRNLTELQNIPKCLTEMDTGSCDGVPMTALQACPCVISTDLNDSGIERSVAEADMTGDEDDDEWEDLDEEEEDEDPEQTILTSHHPQIYCYEECIGWTPDRGVKRSQTNEDFEIIPETPLTPTSAWKKRRIDASSKNASDVKKDRSSKHRHDSHQHSCQDKAHSCCTSCTPKSDTVLLGLNKLQNLYHHKYTTSIRSPDTTPSPSSRPYTLFSPVTQTKDSQSSARRLLLTLSPCKDLLTSVFPSSNDTDPHQGFLDYQTDYYLHRRKLELQFHPIECLANQPQITSGMRGVLVEWLSGIHQQLQLSPESLFLSVNVLDRFLLITPISRDCFQLLGITALLVAAKQEEVYPPEIGELVRLCSGAYTKAQVTQLERLLLCRLQFDLLVPTSQFFLEHHASARMRTAYMAGCSLDDVRRSRAIARCLVELVLQDYSMCQYVPSILALSALEVADMMRHCCTRLGAPYYGGYSRDTLTNCVTDMRIMANVMMQSSPDLEWVYRRYMRVYGNDEY